MIPARQASTKPPPLPKKRPALVAVSPVRKPAEIEDASERTTVDVTPPGGILLVPPPKQSDIRELSGRRPVPPRPVAVPRNAPQVLPAPAPVETKANPESSFSIPLPFAVTEIDVAAPVLEPAIEDEPEDVIPLATTARVVLFVRAVAFFAAYVALAAFHSLREALPLVTARALQRLRAEWTHASERARSR